MLSFVPRGISHAGLQWKTRVPLVSGVSGSSVCLADEGGLELTCPECCGGARLGGLQGGRRQILPPWGSSGKAKALPVSKARQRLE